MHDAWAPYDTYTHATHALCNAHALRELIYVIDTAPPAVADLAAQGAEAMVAVKDLVDDARAGDTQPDPDRMAHQRHLLRSAVVLGKNATAGRATKLERKYNSLFTRLIDRWEDYQRYTTDPAVSFDNNPAEQTIRMPKLRIKVSGCLLSSPPAPRNSPPSVPTPPPQPATAKTCSTSSSKPPTATPGSQPPDTPTAARPMVTRSHQHAQNPDLSSYGWIKGRREHDDAELRR